jgi:carboxypeptidase family protein/TonB-dependent receptor-like protein
MTRAHFALTATVLVLVSGVVVYGQVDRASLNGTVTDSSRAVVADARVELVSRETGQKRVGQTGPTGVYSIPGLPIGTYDLTISCAGFRNFEMNGIQLFVGQTRNIDAELQVGTVTEDVQVQATVAPLETSNARVGAVLEHQQLDDIPINGRNWATLETLAPGAINAGGGGQRDIRFVGRGRDDNNYTFDGIDATGVQEQSQKADARLNISLESIAEFRVESAVYTAESGSSGGAQVNAVSKTGTNSFHGALFEFRRDSAFDARSPFDPSEIPPFRMNQFGANLGGPIVRNRTFFFMNYEAIRQTLTQTIIGFVPNASFRARVLTTSPALKPILDGWPVGQTPVDSNTDLYTAPGVNSVREDSVTGRLDHSFTDRTSMFVRYNIDNASIDKPFDEIGSRDTEAIRPSNLAVQVMHIFSAQAVNEAKFGMNRSTFRHPVLGTTSLGVQSVPGFSDLSPNQLDLEIGTTLSVSDNLSIIHGRHTFKMGADIRRILLNNTSVGIPITVVAFNSPDDFVRDRIDSVSVDGELGVGEMRRTFWMGYGQDQFKVRPNLTLNLGVRYEYYSVMSEASGHIAVVDFACGGFCPAGTPMYAPDRNNFAPRLSAAWVPGGTDGRTTIRTGFGIYYSPGQNDDFSDPHESTAARYALSSADVPNLAYPLTPFLGLLQAEGASPKGIARNRKDGYYENWDLLIQRQLPHSFSGQVGYVGSAGHDLFGGRQVNLKDPITGSRPLPQFGQFQIKYNDSNSNFHSFLASLHRSFTSGWLWQTQYIWSHAIADGSAGTGETAQIQNASCRVCDQSDATFDVRHNLTMNSVYQLPIGPGRSHWNAKGVVGNLIGGWQLSGILMARTGLPVNIAVTRKASDMLDGNSRNQRPDLVPGVPIYPAEQTINNWLNPAAFAVPAKGTWGNLGRNVARGPGYWETDCALEKMTSIGGKTRVKFRAEVFNLLNHPIFANPASNISAASSFGRITSVLNNGAVGTGTPRRMQLMLRAEF